MKANNINIELFHVLLLQSGEGEGGDRAVRGELEMGAEQEDMVP